MSSQKIIKIGSDHLADSEKDTTEHFNINNFPGSTGEILKLALDRYEKRRRTIEAEKEKANQRQKIINENNLAREKKKRKSIENPDGLDEWFIKYIYSIKKSRFNNLQAETIVEQAGTLIAAKIEFDLSSIEGRNTCRIFIYKYLDRYIRHMIRRGTKYLRYQNFHLDDIFNEKAFFANRREKKNLNSIIQDIAHYLQEQERKFIPPEEKNMPSAPPQNQKNISSRPEKQDISVSDWVERHPASPYLFEKVTGKDFVNSLKEEKESQYIVDIADKLSQDSMENGQVQGLRKTSSDPTGLKATDTKDTVSNCGKLIDEIINVSLQSPPISSIPPNFTEIVTTRVEVKDLNINDFYPELYKQLQVFMFRMATHGQINEVLEGHLFPHKPVSEFKKSYEQAPAIFAIKAEKKSQLKKKHIDDQSKAHINEEMVLIYKILSCYTGLKARIDIVSKNHRNEMEERDVGILAEVEYVLFELINSIAQELETKIIIPETEIPNLRKVADVITEFGASGENIITMIKKLNAKS